MRVRVLFFARLRELAGGDSVVMELPQGTTLGALWLLIQDGNPSLKAFAATPLMALNLEYARPETILAGGEEVAFLPPVSGG